MRFSPTTTFGARVAQILGQVLTSAAALLHLMAWPEVSVFTLAFLVAAAFVPLRNDGTMRDLAVCNFSSSLVLAGMVSWDLLALGLDMAGGKELPFFTGAQILVSLVATVLFVFAGSYYWLANREMGS